MLTADGRAVPIIWLGQQTVRRQIGMVPEHLQPIRITTGALGGGLPLRDLRLTADHAVVLDGLLINAGALVNGTTIQAEPVAQSVTAYHVETVAHEVLLAEGARAESFIDYTGRDAFDNHDDYVALYGADRIIREMDLPRISSARLLPKAIKDRLGGLEIHETPPRRIA